MYMYVYMYPVLTQTRHCATYSGSVEKHFLGGLVGAIYGTRGPRGCHVWHPGGAKLSRDIAPRVCHVWHPGGAICPGTWHPGGAMYGTRQVPSVRGHGTQGCLEQILEGRPAAKP